MDGAGVGADPAAMAGRELELPVEVLREGLTLGWDFGVKSLEALARSALELSGNVFERGSLRTTDEGVAFTLRNPPIRMGAFASIRVFWDGTRVPDADVAVGVRASSSPVTLDRVSAAHPVVIPIGERTDFSLKIGPTRLGAHRLRLELQSVAIPPLVYWESEEPLRARD